MAGVFERDVLTLETIHRFDNATLRRDGHLRWPLRRLYDDALVGLGRLAAAYPEVESVGIDTWAVDYGLLDANGELLADPVAYRDGRTDESVERVHRVVSRPELFGINGLQFLPFSTLYQLEAEREGPLWERARHVALLPDLLAYWLTGELASERTNASTTGLLEVRSGEWSTALLDRLGLRADLFAPLVGPGTVLGPLRPGLAARLGMDPAVVVTTVGSHDTASAVAGTPAGRRPFAYVSSGTWSLVGVELCRPVLSDEAQQENFTNERGVGDRIRFLRNTGGFWLVQECLRVWGAGGHPPDPDELFAAAAALPVGGPLLDVDDPTLLAPTDMPARVAAAATGGPTPETPPQIVRCILDSLAMAYAATARRAAVLSGRDVEAVHLVGGGSRRALLCQSTADAAGLPVLAGPVEATALGNVLVQAARHGAAPASLEEGRAMVAASFAPRRFDPS